MGNSAEACFFFSPVNFSQNLKKTHLFLSLKNENIHSNLNVLAVLNNPNGLINSHATTYQINSQANSASNLISLHHNTQNGNNSSHSHSLSQQQSDKQQRCHNSSNNTVIFSQQLPFYVCLFIYKENTVS